MELHHHQIHDQVDDQSPADLSGSADARPYRRMVGSPPEVVRHDGSAPGSVTDLVVFDTEGASATVLGEAGLVSAAGGFAKRATPIEATWSEVDFDQLIWTIPAIRTKTKKSENRIATIPFSSDVSEKSIYRQMNGKIAAIGKKPWLSNLICPKIFLTTEKVVAATTKSVVRSDQLIDRDLGPVPGIHPVSIPFVCDDRAAATRAGTIVDEIIANNNNAIVICNGIRRDNGKVINFERIKGRNDLNDKDIYLIMTMLSPHEYFDLNTLGIFINRTEIIQMHYRDLLTQATGRNTGYRDTGNGRQTVVIQGRKLERAGYFDEAALNSDDPNTIREFVTYRCSDDFWPKHDGVTVFEAEAIDGEAETSNDYSASIGETDMAIAVESIAAFQKANSEHQAFH